MEGLVNNDKVIFASALNISEGGICLMMRSPCEIGEFLELELSLNDAEKNIKVIAEIVWAHWSSFGGFESGLRFKEISGEDRELIGHYCHKRTVH